MLEIIQIKVLSRSFQSKMILTNFLLASRVIYFHDNTFLFVIAPGLEAWSKRLHNFVLDG